MSVKTDLVKEFLVGRIHSAVAERHVQPLPTEIEAALAKSADGLAGDRGRSVFPALAANIARAGYLARVVETELFELARQPPTVLAELLDGARCDVDSVRAIILVSARLANSEPIARPDPDDEHAMTWRIPGPGGHVRHYVAQDAVEWLAGHTDTSGRESGSIAQLKRCWLYGFFLRACEDVAPPNS